LPCVKLPKVREIFLNIRDDNFFTNTDYTDYVYSRLIGTALVTVIDMFSLAELPLTKTTI